MKTIARFASVLFAASLFAAPVMAQRDEPVQLRVSTGGPTGTYSRMFKEFQEVCKDQIMQIEINSSGSIQNMDRLMGNEVNAAIVQTDVLFFRARTENLGGIRTLFSLHPEEVHVITPTVSPIRVGGVMGIRAQPLQLNSVNDLAGQTVVAWGGSFITAQVIRLQSEINFQVREVANFKEAIELINAGQAAAVIMVGGQPMADVANLGAGFKLLPFPEATVAKLKNVYVPARLNYSGMRAGGAGIQTIATDALFVTRTYRTPRFVQALSNLRGCFYANVPELQETTGTHQKWQAVDVTNQGKWPYYELPAAAPVRAVRR